MQNHRGLKHIVGTMYHANISYLTYLQEGGGRGAVSINL